MSGPRLLVTLLVRGARDMRLHPLAHWLAYSAVTLVVFLAGIFLVALSTVDGALSASRGEVMAQVYWRPGIDINFVRAQWQEISQSAWLASMETYTPEEALAALTRRLDREASEGPGGAVSSFTPEDAERAGPLLPPTALLTFAPRVPDPDKWGADLRAHLSTLPGVERVEASPLLDELGRLWRGVSRWLIWPVVVFLCLMLGLVVGNTVRLTLATRQSEIGILQLVGATSGYIRLPLVSAGVLLGVLGGVSGVALLWVARHYSAPLFAMPPLSLDLLFPPPLHVCLLVAVPALTGALSAWLAVRRGSAQ